MYIALSSDAMGKINDKQKESETPCQHRTLCYCSQAWTGLVAKRRFSPGWTG